MLDDVTLLDMMRLGSELAFNAIYKKYATLLKQEAHYHLKRNYGPEHEAEDIAQDILTSIWVRRHEFQFSGSLKAYLLAGVHFKCVDLLRKRRSLHRYQQYKVEFGPLADYNRRLDDKDLGALIEVAFRQLPTGREAVCRLKYKER